MNGRDEPRPEEEEDDDGDWEEARRTPLDAYSWVVFFLLLAIVACLVLLSYAVITLRSGDARIAPPPRPSAAVAASSTGRAPGPSGTIDVSPATGNSVLETEAARALSLARRTRARRGPRG